MQCLYARQGMLHKFLCIISNKRQPQENLAQSREGLSLRVADRMAVFSGGIVTLANMR